MAKEMGKQGMMDKEKMADKGAMAGKKMEKDTLAARTTRTEAGEKKSRSGMDWKM
jgi:hypothetical protein